MKFRHIIALSVALSSAIPTLSARHLTDNHVDSLISSTHVVRIGKTDEASDTAGLRDRLEKFYYDLFRHAQDPESPYFMFMSKDNKLMMGVGGVVRMRGWFDWGGALPVNAFMPYLIPMKPDPAQDKHLGSTPAGTCLYFRIIGSNRAVGEYQAYIEANFNGYGGRDFHLKKAYVTARGITVGYASSTFSDPSAVPSTVDAGGPNNKMDHSAVLVRYMKPFARKFTAAVSVECPDNQIAADGVSAVARSVYIPDFAAFLQYEWSRMQHVRLAGIVRSLPYRNLVTASNHNVAGWAVQLSSVGRPNDNITTYVTANYGAGYAHMGGDLVSGAYDLIGDPDVSGRLYAPRSFGWCLALQYNFRHNLFMTALCSQSRLLPSEKISPEEYKYGLLGAINVFWNPLPRLQFGAEMSVGKRQNFSGEHRYARRFGMMAQLSF